MVELELHCEQALGALRAHAEPPRALNMSNYRDFEDKVFFKESWAAAKQAGRDTGCCMFPRSRGACSSAKIEVASDLGNCHPTVPDQPPAHAIEATMHVSSVQERSLSRVPPLPRWWTSTVTAADSLSVK